MYCRRPCVDKPVLEQRLPSFLALNLFASIHNPAGAHANLLCVLFLSQKQKGCGVALASEVATAS